MSDYFLDASALVKRYIMELLELEGELELRRHLREQLEILERIKVCP